MTHDEVVGRVLQLHRETDRAAVVDRFVASLASRRETWRCPLAGYATTIHLRLHPYERSRLSGGACRVCGLVAQPEPVGDQEFSEWRCRPGASTDLRYIARELLELPAGGARSSTDSDRQLLGEILGAIRRLPRSAQLTELRDCLKGIVPSNRLQRWRLLEILGYCGILCPSTHPSYLERFVGHDEREDLQPEHFFKREWQYPVQHWTGEAGVNMGAVTHWFGRYVGEGAA